MLTGPADRVRDESAARRWRRPGKGTLVLPPVLFVGILLLLPVAFIALYSVGLRTNIPGVPTPFSLSNWKDFLVGGGGAFRSRFVYSMEIALLVSAADDDCRLSPGLFPVVRRAPPAVRSPARPAGAVLH